MLGRNLRPNSMCRKYFISKNSQRTLFIYAPTVDGGFFGLLIAAAGEPLI